MLELSARNQLKGTIKSIATGDVMADIVINVGEQEVSAVITIASVKRLQLRVGDSVIAVIKATDVMVGR